MIARLLGLLMGLVPSSWGIAAVVVMGLVAGSMAYGVHLGRVGAERRCDRERMTWLSEKAKAASDLAAATTRYRMAEATALDALAKSMEDHQHEVDRLQLAIDRERRSGVGLRSQFAAFVADSSRAAADFATESGRSAARARADLQADVFGRIDEAAGGIAAEAGLYRAAGRQCEREHEVGRLLIEAAAGRK